MIAFDDQMKVCRTCRTPKPLDDFRRRAKDKEARLNQCRSCHREAERCRRAEKRSRRAGDEIELFAKAVWRGRMHAEAAPLLALLYEKFGGAIGFAEEFWTTYQQAPPGSNRRVRLLLAFIRLNELDYPRQEAERKARATKYNLMTDEELEQEQNALILGLLPRLIAAKPELAIWAADQLGWQVIPPDELD
jgi:hypothetical protein